MPLMIGLVIGRFSFSHQSQDPERNNESGATHSSTEPRLHEALSRRNTSSGIRGGFQKDLSNILGTNDRVERTRLLLALIDGMSSSEFEEIAKTFQQENWTNHHETEFHLLLAGWIKQDPLATIQYLQDHELNGTARRTAIASWAAMDPEAAAEAVARIDFDGKVNDWMIGLIDGIAQNDLDAALLTLETLPASETKNRAIRAVIPDVVTRGTEYANQWIEMIAEPKMQNIMARNLAAPLARHDPQGASTWIENIQTTKVRRDASEIVADIFAEQDLDAAALWAESLPPDTLTEAAEGVAKHMTRKDPIEAARWLQKLGDDPDLDGARIQFLKEATPLDPETALEHVGSLSKETQRHQFYRTILKAWSRNDPPSAIAWAKAHSESISVRVFRSIVPRDQWDDL